MKKRKSYISVDAFLGQGASILKKGPVALIFSEDHVELGSTVDHHVGLGFRAVVVFGRDLPQDLAEGVVLVDADLYQPDAIETIVNAVIQAAPGIWLYYCYNAEYLFFPFCGSRTVGELLTFHAEERRDAMLTYVVDLYAADLVGFPSGVSRAHTYLDRTGYYAQARLDPDNNNHPKDRQLDFFGGLRWRFEEHIPTERRKIDRISLFKAKVGLTLRHDHTFDDEEYNTYSCPWHHNLTAAVCSFRAAKALRSNPGSRFVIDSFAWHNSIPFEWNADQLMSLGLMEPGQWF